MIIAVRIIFEGSFTERKAREKVKEKKLRLNFLYIYIYISQYILYCHLRIQEEKKDNEKLNNLNLKSGKKKLKHFSKIKKKKSKVKSQNWITNDGTKTEIGNLPDKIFKNCK